jgi:hypothetical protein
LISSIPDQKTANKPKGAPKIKRTRQCLLAALYHCRLCKSKMTIPAFARGLPKVVEIKWSRTSPPTYVTYKSQNALEADLRRGLRENTVSDWTDAFWGWIFWRTTHVNPKWGFQVGPNPHLLVTPKKPTELIDWIDAFIQAKGLEEVVERFKAYKII